MTTPNPLDTPSAREVARKYPQGSLLGALFGTVLFGGVSAVMTGAAPVSRIELVRAGGKVAAHVETCIFFRWPYRTATVDPVTGVSSEVRAGKKLHKRPGDGIPHHRRSESQGYLALESNDDTVWVTVHRTAVKETAAKVSAFLADANADRLDFRVETHPIVGTWVPALFTIPMALLCAFGLVAGTIQRVVAGALRTLGPRTEDEPVTRSEA
jgi:hypothetical protein